MRLTATLVLALLGIGACTGQDGVAPRQEGTTRILLTDAPFPFDQVRSVDVHIVSIAATRNFDTTTTVEWTTLAEPNRTVNLLELQDGATTVLGETQVPAGEYAAVRMAINTTLSGITRADGSPAVVEWGGPAQQMLFALVEQPLSVPDDGADLIIDFDVGRSFIVSIEGTFTFLPWIRAVNEAATGTVRGVVRGANLPSEVLGPVPNASITVYRGTSPLTLAATGRTDAQGRFAIHYVSGGGPYVIQATPPAGFNADPGYTGQIMVTPGEETTADVMLGTEPPGTLDGARLVISGPEQTTVGQTIWLYAFVFGANGDSVLGPPVTWTNANPAVVSLTGAGSAVQLTGLAVGSATITATSDQLADTAVITVGEPVAPVASIEVVPASLTLAVGDSAGLQAVLRDAVGNLLNDRSVAWSVDSAVVNVIGQFGQYLLIRAVAPGTRLIRAFAEGKEGTAMVVVN
jgi:Domain of unknown function (DUF4382)/Bacterial Ig-like domain (group 2)